MKLIVILSLISIASTSGILSPRKEEREDADKTLIPLTISAVKLGDTFHSAKDSIAQRRKLEENLVRKGKLPVLMSDFEADQAFFALTTTRMHWNG